MVAWVRAVAGAVTAVTLIGCRPEFGERAFSVSAPRVLSIQSDPAETKPDVPVTYAALVAGPQGPIANPALDWALCSDRRTLVEAGPIAATCLTMDSASLTHFGNGNPAAASVPKTACRLFGPDPPEPKPGEPPGRPVDPDPTGGFYLPVRLAFDDGQGIEFSAGSTRLQCGLPGATQEQAVEYEKAYRPNTNPSISELRLHRGGAIESVTFPAGSDPTVTAHPNENLAWEPVWPACPTDPVCGDGVCLPNESVSSCAADCTKPVGCAGAETYMFFEPNQHVLVTGREWVRVSFFATGGTFDVDRVGRAEDDRTTSVLNAWTAPPSAGRAWVWFVIRDARGGLGWSTVIVDVQP